MTKYSIFHDFLQLWSNIVQRFLSFWYWNFTQLFIHTRANWIQKFSLIKLEMRALRSHKVSTCNKLDDFYKFWYDISERAIVCLQWNFESFLIETRSKCSDNIKVIRRKMLVQFASKVFTWKTRIISFFCSLFAFLWNVGVYFWYIKQLKWI